MTVAAPEPTKPYNPLGPRYRGYLLDEMSKDDLIMAHKEMDQFLQQQRENHERDIAIFMLKT